MTSRSAALPPPPPGFRDRLVPPLSETVGNGPNGTFLISDSAGTNKRRWTTTTELVITTLGIGVNTDAPKTKLHVRGSDIGSDDAPALFEARNCGAPCAQDTWTEGARLLNSNVNGRIGLGFHVSATLFPVTQTPMVWIGTTDNVNAGAANTLVIATNSAGVLTERVRVEGSTGNLHVSGGDVRITNPGVLRLGTNQTVHDGGNGSTIVRGDSVVLSTNGSGGVALSPSGTGRVGVGLFPTANGRMLQVLGDIEASGFLYSGVAKGFLVQAAAGDPAAGWFVADANSAYKITANGALTASRRTLLASAYAATGWGRAVAEMANFSDGTSQIRWYNDLAVGGGYGASGNSSQPFAMQIQGGSQNTLTHQTAVLQVETDTSRVGVSLRASTVANLIRVQTDIAGFLFRNSDDTGYVPLLASAFTVNSARESKRKVRALKAAPARDSILALKPCLFDRPGQVFTDTKKKGPPTHHGGLIADEVAEHIPEAVTWLDGKPHGLDYAPIVARLIKTVQDQDRRLELLEAK